MILFMVLFMWFNDEIGQWRTGMNDKINCASLGKAIVCSCSKMNLSCLNEIALNLSGYSDKNARHFVP